MNDDISQRVEKLEEQFKRLLEIVEAIAHSSAVSEGFAFDLLMLQNDATDEQVSAVYRAIGDLETQVQGGGRIDVVAFESSIENIFRMKPGSGHALAGSIIGAFQREGRFRSVVNALYESKWYGSQNAGAQK